MHNRYDNVIVSDTVHQESIEVFVKDYTTVRTTIKKQNEGSDKIIPDPLKITVK